MHLGSLATSAKVKNMFHIVFNNNSHDSVGGQKTATEGVEYYKIAKSLGYKYCFRANNKKNLLKAIKNSMKLKNSIFLEVLCSKGNRPDLSRPKKKMIMYKKLFINFLKK